MGRCIDCAQYTEESSFCAKHKTKKTADATCRSFHARIDVPAPKTTAEIKRLNELVTWMRKREVIALKAGPTAITLGSLVEPNAETEASSTTPQTPEEIKARIRNQRANDWYPGGIPQKRGDR